MTSPEDPNAPHGSGEQPPGQPGTRPEDQPGWAAPLPQVQQGWGTPPSPEAQPGWGAPPPAQPGWGAPPPPPPGAQPGWGGPPPGAQPGWGAPPPPPPGAQPGWGGPPPQGYPGWGQPGWGAPPRRKGHGCLIAALIVVGLLVVLVGGCAWLIGPIVGTELKLTQDLGPRATSVDFNWNNGATIFTIHLTAGYESQAERIACQIVKPDLRTSSTPDAHFVIESSSGHILADETTPCG